MPPDWGQNVGRPVKPCGILKTHVSPCVAGLDLLQNPLLGDCCLEAFKTRFLEAWMLAGLERIGGGGFFMGRWDPRMSHTLELEALGGLL